MRKPLLFALCFAFACGGLSAQQTPTWQPSPGHTQVPIWPAKPPDSQPVKELEFALSSGTGFLVAGKSATEVDNVTRPTMTVYSPKRENTGPAFNVFRGGGFYVLSVCHSATRAAALQI